MSADYDKSPHNGGYMPSKKMPLPDSVTAATPRPLQETIITSGVNADNESLYLYVEVNHSNDWNQYYRQEAEPEAGNSSHDNGQPSVIYRTEIDFSKTGTYELTPIGTGDVNGRDGIIDNDMSKLTSALQIVNTIKVKIQ